LRGVLRLAHTLHTLEGAADDCPPYRYRGAARFDLIGGDRVLRAESMARRARQAVALPVYTVALLLDYLSAALGRLAAWIAGDDWP